MLFEFGLHTVLHVHLLRHRLFAIKEVLLNDRRTDVARHDDDGILEIDRPPLPIRQASVVQHLKQDVENIVVGLFNFVEKHHAVGTAANRFTELPAFLITHVARRRAHQPRHGVFLHVFTHVNPYHRVVVVEKEFRECLGQFGFANASGSHEDERTDRPVRVLQSASGAAHRI